MRRCDVFIGWWHWECRWVHHTDVRVNSDQPSIIMNRSRITPASPEYPIFSLALRSLWKPPMSWDEHIASSTPVLYKRAPSRCCWMSQPHTQTQLPGNDDDLVLLSFLWIWRKAQRWEEANESSECMYVCMHAVINCPARKRRGPNPSMCVLMDLQRRGRFCAPGGWNAACAHDSGIQ